MGMDHTTSSVADYYHEKAREIGRLASQSRSADVRLQLFEVAELFRRMTAHVGRRMSSENAGRNLDRATARNPSPGRWRGKASMKIRDVMTPDIEVVTPDDKLRTAARLMADLDFEALPVSEDNKLVGTITGRDIAVRIVANGGDPEGTTVHQAMSTDPLYCFENERAEDVARKMGDWWVRRLPVVKQDKHLIGMVSFADLTILQSVSRRREIGEPLHRPRAARSTRQARRPHRTPAAA